MIKAEGCLGAGFLSGHNTIHVFTLFGVSRILADPERFAVGCVVVFADLGFQSLAGGLVLTFPGEPVNALPYVVYGGVESESVAFVNIDEFFLDANQRNVRGEGNLHGVGNHVAVVVGGAGNAVELRFGGRRFPDGVKVAYGSSSSS